MLIEQWGKNTRLAIRETFYAAGFCFEILRHSLFLFREKQVSFRVLVLQIFFTGVQALPIISLMSLALGAVIIIQGSALLPQFGQGDLIYPILITIITREMGPVLTAFIIIARSGSAITTELGNMVISHEVEAYVSVGINPLSYLGAPRLLGVTFSMILLNLYFNAFGLFGSYLVSLLVNPLPLQEYFQGLLQTLTLRDLMVSNLKSACFGLLIGFTSLYYGFKVTRSITEVPQKNIKAIGGSLVLCILLDGVLTALSYLL